MRRLEPVDNWVAVKEIFLIQYDKDYYTPIFPNLSSLAATQTAAIPRTEQMSGWCRCSWIIAPLYSLGLRIIRQKQRFALARTRGSSPRQVLHTPEKGSTSSYTTLRSPVYPCCGTNLPAEPPTFPQSSSRNLRAPYAKPVSGSSHALCQRLRRATMATPSTSTTRRRSAGVQGPGFRIHLLALKRDGASQS